MMRRCSMALAFLALPFMSGAAAAQSAWKPQKPIEIIVGTSAGGGQDRSARTVQRLIQERNLLEVASNVVNKPGGDSLAALLGGHIDVMTSTTGAPLPQHRAGKVRILAIGARERLPGDLAAVPTWREQGVNAEFSNWRGMVGPGGLTQPQIAFWERVLAAVVETPEFKQDLEKNSWVANFAKSTEMRKRLQEEHEELKALLTELGMAK